MDNFEKSKKPRNDVEDDKKSSMSRWVSAEINDNGCSKMYMQVLESSSKDGDDSCLICASVSPHKYMRPLKSSTPKKPVSKGNTPQSPKKPVSKGNTPQSPRRATLFEKKIARKGKRKLFVDVSDYEEEVQEEVVCEQTQQTQSSMDKESQSTQASVAENMPEPKSQPISTVEDLHRFSEGYNRSDEFLVQLPNIEEDECHPDEDINNLPGYEQEFKDAMYYKKFLKKVENGYDIESEGGCDADSVGGYLELGGAEEENDKDVMVSEDHIGDFLDSDSEKEGPGTVILSFALKNCTTLTFADTRAMQRGRDVRGQQTYYYHRKANGVEVIHKKILPLGPRCTIAIAGSSDWGKALHVRMLPLVKPTSTSEEIESFARKCMLKIPPSVGDGMPSSAIITCIDRVNGYPVPHLLVCDREANSVERRKERYAIAGCCYDNIPQFLLDNFKNGDIPTAEAYDLGTDCVSVVAGNAETDCIGRRLGDDAYVGGSRYSALMTYGKQIFLDTEIIQHKFIFNKVAHPLI